MTSSGYRIYAVRYAHRKCSSSEVFYHDHHDAPMTMDDFVFDRINALASSKELILPGHDPLVIERLTNVADGIVEL